MTDDEARQLLIRLQLGSLSPEEANAAREALSAHGPLAERPAGWRDRVAAAERSGDAAAVQRERMNPYGLTPRCWEWRR